MSPPTKVFALIGPTASGKTETALALAAHLPIEIISIDSALVYRAMDVGTAKATLIQRATIPHHLIDIINPDETYSVAQFHIDTLRLIKDIHARGKIPVLVGGTMMYYKALEWGLDTLPPANLAIRAELNMQLQSIGIVALHAQLGIVDPESAERLKPTDTQRILRALEIFRILGTPMSILLHREAPVKLPFDLYTFSLEPSDRTILHQRIGHRFNAMLNGSNGTDLITEVRKLRTNFPNLHPDLPSIRCVGYRQTWQYLDGKINFAQLKEQGIIATRQLAKRQLTWLRAMPHRIMVDCLNPAAFDIIFNKIKSKLGQD